MISKERKWIAFLLIIAVIAQTFLLSSGVYAIDEDNGASVSSEEQTDSEEVATDEAITEDSIQPTEKKETDKDTSEQKDEKPKEKSSIKPMAVVEDRPTTGPMDLKDLYEYKQIQPPTIVSSFALTFYENGQVTDHPTVNAQIQGKLDFSINEAVRRAMIDGDSYTLTLPNEIQSSSRQVYDLVGQNNVIYGQAILENKQLKLEFNEKVSELYGITGEVEFAANFDRNNVNSGGNNTLIVPAEPTSIPINVNIKTLADNAIDKRGFFDREYNPTAIRWQVDFNKTNDMMTNGTIDDALPAGTSLTGINVYQLTIDPSNGDITEVTSISNGFNTSGTSVTFPGTTSSAYRIEYETDIIDPDQYFETGGHTFRNTADWTADNKEPLSASSTLTARYGKFIEKTGSYDASRQVINWTIKYNYSGADIPQAEALIQDKFQTEGLQLIENSFDVNQIGLNDRGAEINSTPITGGYTVTPTTGGFGGFDFQFNSNVNTPVKIQYQTSVSGIVEGSKAYNNEAETEYNSTDYSSTGTGNAYQQNVIKRVIRGDEDERLITWQVRVNLNRYELENWKLTDTLGPNHVLANYIEGNPYGEVDITDLTDGDPLIWDADNQNSDYKVDVTNGAFTIEFLNGTPNQYADGTDHEFLLEFQTHYNLNFTGTTIPNNATVEWETGGQPHRSSSGDRFYRTALDVDNGAKYGEYNAQTKTITWTVLVNNSGTNIRYAGFVDVFKGNQQYVDDSLKIYNYSLNNQNEPIRSTVEVDRNNLVIGEPPVLGSNTITIAFPESYTDRFWIEYETTLDGQYIDVSSAYDNVATFTAIGPSEQEINNVLDARVSIANGGELAVKEGRQNNDGSVHWEVTVNPSQSTLENPVLKDIPSDNQKIQTDSIRIYRADVAQNGALTKTNQLVTEGSFYTVDYSLNESTGQMELTINFLETIDEAYFLEYDTLVFMNNISEMVTNSVNLTGQNNGTRTDGDNKGFTASYIRGGGSIYGSSGSVILQKTNLGGDNLEGAVFELQDTNGNTVITHEVNTNGALQINNIVQGDYVLFERRAPEGHSIAGDLRTGRPITVNADTTLGQPVDVTNTPSSVQLTKQNVSGAGLQAAEYYLYENDGSNWQRIRSGQQLITNNNGLLTVSALDAGNYRFIENTAPNGHIKNSDPIDFTITRSAGVLNDVSVQATNYQGSVEMEKTNVSGAALTGASFDLVRVASDNTKTTVSSLSTDDNGIVSASGLAPGTYQFVETLAPDDYLLPLNPMQFEITDEASGDPGVMDLGGFINYEFLGVINIHKVDGENQPLDGAIFDLYHVVSDDAILLQSGITTSGGSVSIGALHPGDYRLVETRAPEGYTTDGPIEDINITYDQIGNGEEHDQTVINNKIPPDEPIPPTPPGGGDTGDDSVTVSSSSSGFTSDPFNMLLMIVLILAAIGVGTWVIRKRLQK